MGRHTAVAWPRPAWVVELVTLISLVTLVLTARRPPGRRRAGRDTPTPAAPGGPAYAAQHRKPSPYPRALTSSPAGQ